MTFRRFCAAVDICLIFKDNQPMVRLLFACLLIVMAVGDARAAEVVAVSTAPVQFLADTVSYDEEAQAVTALGDVEVVQGLQILRADKMVYHLSEDKVSALGNVSLMDEHGNVHFAEYVDLKDKMKDGFVQGLLILLADGSRFTAAEAKRENGGTLTTMTDGSYTACKVCEKNPKPLWQIRASKVVHDTTSKTVDYTNARLEFLGVPLAYTPIFSHPDPTLKRKSGLTRPQYGWSSLLGTHLKGGYYFDLAPDKDMTLQAEVTSLAGTRVEGEWRQRFENGKLRLRGSTAASDRKEEDGRVETGIQRGHIFADGGFDLSDIWRTGFSLARASDKQYLRLYDISSEDVLTSEVYAERFSGRNYSRIGTFSFQDLRLGIRPEQPDILPMAEHHMIGDAGATLGGRWQAGLSLLGLMRNANAQDVQRASADLGWERRDISSLGLATTLRLDGHGDFYSIQNSDASRADPALDSQSATLRALGTGTLISSYPLVRNLSRMQATIEPIAGVSLGSPAKNSSRKIPNEDSLDVRFDNSNLFDVNRFPGIDRQEDGGRVNFGLKAGLHGPEGGFGRVFFGQSYRFMGDRIFPAGSGLNNRLSDFVGQIKVGLQPLFSLDYRYQLDSETLAARRHEVQASGGTERLRLDTRYMFIGAVAGTGFSESRQQIGVGGSYKLTKRWTFDTTGLVDIGDEPGLRNAAGGFTYLDECFTFSIQASRNVANAASGNDDTRVIMRIGFKNIGEFAAPHISLGKRQERQ